MMTPREMAGVIFGLGRLLRLDRQAFKHFVPTVDGFWHSFYGAWLVLPLFLVQSLGAYFSDEEPPADFLRYIVVELSTYTIGWVLFPLVMLRITALLGKQRQYFNHIVAYNWFQVPVNVAMLSLVLLAYFGVLPDQALQLLLTMLTTAVLFYTWFLARHGLEVDGVTAVGIVLLDIMLSALIGVVGHGMIAGWGGALGPDLGSE